MKLFSLWAPNASTCTLHLDGSDYPMQRFGDSFHIRLPQPPAGSRYGFSVDGAAVLPDPRSQAQPDGVHGLSAVVDPSLITTRSRAHNQLAQPSFDVIYELHVGAFAGDFDGVIARLDYLCALGVSAIELMPIQPFSGNFNWGYDGVSWFAVHEGYGGMAGLCRLIDAAHERQIAVILDVVYNHFGPEGNYTDTFGPYTLKKRTPWGAQINVRNPKVRSFILDAARQWLDLGVDGLRLDATHTFAEEELLTDFALLDGWICAEDLRDRADLPVTCQWNDELMLALGRCVEHGGSVDELVQELRLRYPSVVYTSTHDSVGNRPLGDRPSMRLDAPALLCAFALIAALDAPVMLFMGEEYAADTPFPFFCDHQDESTRQHTRVGRAKMLKERDFFTPAPDPLAKSTFESAALLFDVDKTPHSQQVWDGYRAIIRAKRTHPINATSVMVEDGWLVLRGDQGFIRANMSTTNLTHPDTGQACAPYTFEWCTTLGEVIVN
ncbi:MAG: alpha-amylase family glycosyl hydrolase [Corynebacterium sp.]|uniref:alpha-amylase family glycosyl hydrolase n=1 Tax=Corynebacterium sp. TaxID=1720 RepID=UPI0026DBC5DE|nr:alpha-amylase family glycosyl hydrolase [Corynebacterium sp.]MDO4762146.1 alpha-amylase family glycosyl hydrolase [Corynebacterium sp.]